MSLRCVSYCTCASFDSARLFLFLKSRYGAKRFREVIHVKVQSEHLSDEGDVFFFPYGAVVIWGLGQQQDAAILAEIKEFQTQALENPDVDVFDYAYGEQASIVDDEIILPDHAIITKLAFSYAIAQSVKLDIFEQTIQKTFHLTRDLPEYLANKGDISLSRKQMRKMMGRLFIDRHSINLHQELLDTPEFFWDHSDLEKFYIMTTHYLDKERRINILNQRLTVLKELFDMLNTELNHYHSTMLEWIIVVLISIEVLTNIVLHLVKS
ncbi:MAG: RMD1 family protein [Gammaproteobacteria bacterium]